MRTFGMSAAVVLALAAPAWGSYPPPAPAGFAPVNYNVPPNVALPSIPAPGVPPGGWYAPPGADAFTPVPGALPLGVLPPGELAPAGPPPGATADPSGFAFDPCYPCNRTARPRVTNESWVRGDWLYWKFRDAPVPPLLVTGNPAVPGAGVPGSGNTFPLVGPARDLGYFSGVRVAAGMWLDPDGELGVEVGGFIFGRESTADFFQGGPTQSVSVPVIGTNGALQTYDFSFPGRFTGNAGVKLATNLLGGEASVLHRFFGNGCVSVDGLFGYRYVQMNERLDLLGRTQATGAIATFLGTPLPNGVTVFTNDSFRGRTEFHGAQFGGRLEVRRDMFTVTAVGKGGLGANIQSLSADGTTTVTGFGVTRTALGGVRVLPTNFGGDSRTRFSGLAEVGLELGLQVTRHASLRVGYNALWWSGVLRPGSVITPVATLTQVPIDPTFRAGAPATQPVTALRSSDFLAHGLVVGAVFDW